VSRNEDDEIFGTLTLNGKPLFESAWLKACDLCGRDANVVIESVERCEVFNRRKNAKEFKVALMFKGKKKGLICNKTNAESIGKATGITEAQQWIGQQVTLYPTKCKVSGKITDCIRVRDKKSTATPKPDATDLNAQNESYSSIERRIMNKPTSAQGAALKEEIIAAVNGGELTQDQADELTEKLRVEMN